MGSAGQVKFSYFFVFCLFRRSFNKVCSCFSREISQIIIFGLGMNCIMTNRPVGKLAPLPLFSLHEMYVLMHSKHAISKFQPKKVSAPPTLPPQKKNKREMISTAISACCIPVFLMNQSFVSSDPRPDIRLYVMSGGLEGEGGCRRRRRRV